MRISFNNAWFPKIRWTSERTGILTIGWLNKYQAGVICSNGSWYIGTDRHEPEGRSYDGVIHNWAQWLSTQWDKEVARQKAVADLSEGPFQPVVKPSKLPQARLLKSGPQ